jgi:hypothetical protein
MNSTYKPIGSFLTILVGLTFSLAPSVKGGTITYGPQGTKTKLTYGTGTAVSGKTLRDITLNGLPNGYISTSGAYQVLQMGPLLVTGTGGIINGSEGLLKFPNTNIQAGAILNIGRYVHLNLGTLSCAGTLNILTSDASVEFTGTCAHLNAARPPTAPRLNPAPSLTIGSGSVIGNMNIGKTRLSLAGSLTVDSLLMDCRSELMCQVGTPIIVKKRLSIQLSPSFIIKALGNARLTSEFVLIDNQGTEPVQVSGADRTLIEQFVGNLGIQAAPRKLLWQRFKMVINSGDGNDVSIIPLLPIP